VSADQSIEPLLPWSPPLRARIRVVPEDFRVDEIPATVPSGNGEHLWLQIRKTGLNSEDVAEWLAEAASVPRASVSYAGRKDRHAITSQWFSVHLPGRADPAWSEGRRPAGVELLDQLRHARKLQTGHLQGNRFRLRLREIEGDRSMAEALLERIVSRGLPDYFGEQRFGHGNLHKAIGWFTGRLRPRGRNQRSLYLSAARAAIFNAVLRKRVEDGSWDRLLPGDIANLDGRGSVFAAERIDAELSARCARLEVHPTGPLWGRGDPATDGAVRDLELAVARSFTELSEGLAGQGVEHSRRPLRMRPLRMSWSWEENGDLLLDFELRSGEYATTVIGAIALVQDDSGNRKAE